MSIEPHEAAIRLGFFLGVFALVALWGLALRDRDEENERLTRELEEKIGFLGVAVRKIRRDAKRGPR